MNKIVIAIISLLAIAVGAAIVTPMIINYKPNNPVPVESTSISSIGTTAMADIEDTVTTETVTMESEGFTETITSTETELTTDEAELTTHTVTETDPPVTTKPKETKPPKTTTKETESEVETTTDISEQTETEVNELVVYPKTLKVWLATDVNVWCIVPNGQRWYSLLGLENDQESIDVEVVIEDKHFYGHYKYGEYGYKNAQDWVIWFRGNPFPKQHTVISDGRNIGVQPKLILQGVTCQVICNNMLVNFVVDKYSSDNSVSVSGGIEDGVYQRYGSWLSETDQTNMGIVLPEPIEIKLVVGKTTVVYELPEGLTWEDVLGLNTDEMIGNRQKFSGNSKEWANIYLSCISKSQSGINIGSITNGNPITIGGRFYNGSSPNSLNKSYALVFSGCNGELDSNYKYQFLNNGYYSRPMDKNEYEPTKGIVWIDSQFQYSNGNTTEDVAVYPIDVYNWGAGCADQIITKISSRPLFTITVVDQTEAGSVYDDIFYNQVFITNPR